MKRTFDNCNIYTEHGFRTGDIFNDAGTVKAVLRDTAPDALSRSNQGRLFVFPGFADVHVHLREPGFSYKETIRTGTKAAVHGGYTALCAMPNLCPAPDCLEHLKIETELIRRDAAINVYPYGTITRGEEGGQLSDMEALAPYICAFSDDGYGVQDEERMRAAMLEAKRLDRMIVAHCEDNAFLHGGCIHDGAYAKASGLPGIPSESEWRQVRRDLRLAEETGCSYHVCHVSTKESVALIRSAKAAGVDVTCETAPHYLLLDDSMLEDDGRFRMNPPIRSRADREALLEGLSDGTVDMIATDHAPHTKEEKSRGLAGSLNGIVGLECAFPVLYTGLVKTGILSLERLIELLTDAPRTRFGIPRDPNDFTVYDLDEEFEIDPGTFLSKGKSTPFTGWKVFGACLLTVCGGRVVWADGRFSDSGWEGSTDEAER